MSNVNVLSNKVLGKPLLPEFIPPGKPTGERVAVEYLLAQSNRGDLLSQQIGIGDILPEILDEDIEDECPDVTVPQAHDLTFQITKKLSGLAKGPALWLTSVSNEVGQILISVLTAQEGPALDTMAADLIRRYSNAGVAPPQLLC
ncbi:unnamed protein product [Leuciscus chuanchicus]